MDTVSGVITGLFWLAAVASFWLVTPDRLTYWRRKWSKTNRFVGNKCAATLEPRPTRAVTGAPAAARPDGSPPQGRAANPPGDAA